MANTRSPESQLTEEILLHYTPPQVDIHDLNDNGMLFNLDDMNLVHAVDVMLDYLNQTNPTEIYNFFSLSKNQMDINNKNKRIGVLSTQHTGAE